MRYWAINNTTLRDIIESDANQDRDISVKVMGLVWQTDWDFLSHSPQTVCLNANIHAKNEVAKVTSPLFDPLVFLSPIHIQAKISN